MDTTEIPNDFKEFFRSLNKAAVEYLLVGGYAVGIHGYVRPVLAKSASLATLRSTRYVARVGIAAKRNL
jgi:hypothetical protein